MSGTFWIYAVAAGAIVLSFPIFITFGAYCDVRKNRCFYGVYLFKVLKLYSGYAQLEKKGIIFHLSSKKAVLLPYENVFESGKKFEVTKGFEIIRYRQIVEFGSASDMATPIYICSLLQVLTGIYYGKHKQKKPFTNISATSVLAEGEDILKISLNAVGVFNVVVLIMAGAKIVLEKIYSYAKRKQQDR